MQAILQLEKLGYVFTIEGGSLGYKLRRLLPSDVSGINSLLAEVRLHKDEAISFLKERTVKQAQLRLEYNRLLERERKAEAWLDAPERTDEESEKWTPLFRQILTELNKFISEIGLDNCSADERMNGFEIAPLLGHEVSLETLPDEWKEVS